MNRRSTLAGCSRPSGRQPEADKVRPQRSPLDAPPGTGGERGRPEPVGKTWRPWCGTVRTIGASRIETAAANGLDSRPSGSHREQFVIRYFDVEFHRSAFKHGHAESAIFHALDHAMVAVDLDPDADPPRMLAIGPDPAGNLLEVIWLRLDGVELVIHAMGLRPTFRDLLSTGDHQP